MPRYKEDPDNKYYVSRKQDVDCFMMVYALNMISSCDLLYGVLLPNRAMPSHLQTWKNVYTMKRTSFSAHYIETDSYDANENVVGKQKQKTKWYRVMPLSSLRTQNFL